MKPLHPMHSDYYEKTFTPEEVEEGLRLYLAYMKRNHLKPEVKTMDVLEIEGTELLNHVMYHAEIEQDHRGTHTINFKLPLKKYKLEAEGKATDEEDFALFLQDIAKKVREGYTEGYDMNYTWAILVEETEEEENE